MANVLGMARGEQIFELHRQGVRCARAQKPPQVPALHEMRAAIPERWPANRICPNCTKVKGRPWT